MPAVVTIQVRGGTAAQWTSANPVLANREAGLETDTLKLKYGNGVSAWTALPYFTGNVALLAANKALISDGSGVISPSGVTAAELASLSGVTSAVQGQINGKAASSHIHTIANVTGLQTNLDTLQSNVDAKAAASHVHTIADSTGLQAALDAKLANSTATNRLLGRGAAGTGVVQQITLGANLSLSGTTLNANVTGTLPGFYIVTDYGVTNAGVDTTAALQTLIDTVYVAGGGTIFFPPGIYLIGGALQDPSVRNAQIVIPQTATTAQPITIQFVGTTAPPTQYIGSSMNLPLGTYSIIKSTLTGATGTAALFGADPVSGLYNNTRVCFKDLVFWMPANPTLTCLNMSRAVSSRFEHLMVHTGSTSQGTIAQPTHSNAYGIRLPGNNTGDYVYVEGVQVFGHYTGLQVGELTMIIFAESWACINAFEFQFTFHPSKIEMLLSVWCQNGLVMAAGSTNPHYTTIGLYDMEHANGSGPGWMDTVYDVNDASNLLRGDVKWMSIAAAIGLDHSFIKNGGTHMIATELGAV